MTIQRLELEAKEAADRVARVETERDAARHEVVMAWLEIEAVGSAPVQVELELSRVQSALSTSEGGRMQAGSKLGSVQQALVAAKEACQRVEEDNGRLSDERLSLLVELGTTKDDITDFWEKSFVERSALEAEFDASNDVIFNYGYVWDAGYIYHLTPEFFVNPRCPSRSSLALSTVEPVKTAEEDLADKGLPDAKGEVDILLESLTMPNKATEGYGKKPSDVFCTTIYSILLFLVFWIKCIFSA